MIIPPHPPLVKSVRLETEGEWGDLKLFSKGNKNMWRPILLIALIITIFILAIVLGAGEKLGVLREWIQSLGVLGPAVFVGLYILGVVVGIPGSALTVAAGGLFGSFLGVILVSLASTIGASFSFLLPDTSPEML